MNIINKICYNKGGEYDNMNTDELKTILDNIQEKVGEELSSTIADDLGLLITKNEETLNQINAINEKNKKLDDLNKNLVNANANLYQQIPMKKEELKEEKQETKKMNDIDYYGLFDKNGKFKIGE